MTDVMLPLDSSPGAVAEANYSSLPPSDQELQWLLDESNLPLTYIPTDWDAELRTLVTDYNVSLMRRIVARMRGAGLRVVVIDGWETRGRPGEFQPVGLLQHHDASSTSTGVKGFLVGVIKGRPDLEGPLSQWFQDREGTWYLVAAGRANHAGSGGPWRVVPEDSGNRYLMGTEVANNGTGERYSAAQARSLDIGLACQLIELNKDSSWLIGHKEWTPRKIDPFGIIMSTQRVEVGSWVTAILEDDMASPEEIAKAVWSYKFPDETRPKVGTPPAYPRYSAGAFLQWIRGDARKTSTELVLVKSQVAAVVAKVDALGSGPGGSVTKQDVEDAIRPLRALLPGE